MFIVFVPVRERTNTDAFVLLILCFYCFHLNKDKINAFTTYIDCFSFMFLMTSRRAERLIQYMSIRV